MRYFQAPFLMTVGILIAISGLAAPGSAAERQPAPKDAYAYIGWPNNGEVVTQRFKVWLGLRNFGVAPAGVNRANTGHHHLLIDADVPADLSQPLAANEHSVHFGKGQTETTLTLAPGKHTLQLVLGDSLHVPHDPAVISKKITIDVGK